MTREQRHQKSAFVLRNLQTASPNGLGQFIRSAVLIGLAIHLFIFGTVFSLLFPTEHGTAFIWSLITGPIVWVIVQFMIPPPIKTNHKRQAGLLRDVCLVPQAVQFVDGQLSIGTAILTMKRVGAIYAF